MHQQNADGNGFFGLRSWVCIKLVLLQETWGAPIRAPLASCRLGGVPINPTQGLQGSSCARNVVSLQTTNRTTGIIQIGLHAEVSEISMHFSFIHTCDVDLLSLHIAHNLRTFLLRTAFTRCATCFG